MTDNRILVCPNCDRSHLFRLSASNAGTPRTKSSDTDRYYCDECGEGCRHPNRREQKNAGNISTDGLAKRLLEADPDDV